MPEICRFFGIIVRMLYNEHNPPHFHAEYGEYKIVVRIADLSVMAGSFPHRAFGLLMEWAQIHRDELSKEWEGAKSGSLFKIAPLE
jgi:phosphomannomutase